MPDPIVSLLGSLVGIAFGVVALVCGVGALWREEVELSFATGMWRMRRGFAWSGVTETRGTLADIPEVELALDRRASSEDGSPTWVVRIQAPAWPGPPAWPGAPRNGWRRPPRRPRTGRLRTGRCRVW